MEKNKKLRYTSLGFVLPLEYNPTEVSQVNKYQLACL